MPKDFNFLYRADLSMPIKSAVLEYCHDAFNWFNKYSFSNALLLLLMEIGKTVQKYFYYFQFLKWGSGHQSLD